MEQTIGKIKAEIERLKDQLVRGACASQKEMETRCKEEAYDEILDFINSLPEEPASKELEEAVLDWVDEYCFDCDSVGENRAKSAFKAGAQWQLNHVWHKASEEPKEGFTIIVYMNDDSTIILSSWKENGDFCLNSHFWYNIHRQRCWAYADDILPTKSE